MVPVCPEKGGETRFLLCPLTTPLWRLVGCRRPPEIKLDVGVFWGDSELVLLEEGRRKEEKKDRRKKRKKKEAFVDNDILRRKKEEKGSRKEKIAGET